MEDIQRELSLLTDVALSQLLNELLSQCSEETILALEESRKRRRFGLGKIFRAVTFAHVEKITLSRLGALYSEAALYGEEPAHISREISSLKGRLLRARKDAFR